MRFIVIILFLILPVFARAQQNPSIAKDTIPFSRMSLEELMNVNVTVASQLPMTSQEAPGIVTIINADEIRKSGANDLMQLLQQVPGFDFGVDVEGVIGIGVRGNWAHEGKVLLIWDGMELNEELFSTLQFGLHYPLDQVNKIEIIRGPGSAIYGGNAEYAVINVTTINNAAFEGVTTSVYNSQMSSTFAARGVSVAAGKAFNDVHLNISTVINQGNRSQEDYIDNYGMSYNMADQSQLSDEQYRMDFNVKGFSLTGLYDNYSVDQRDGYDKIYLRPYKTNFGAGYICAKYELKKSQKLEITPGIRFKFQEPWSYNKPVTDDVFEPFSTSVNKKEYFINTNYNPDSRINLIGGLEFNNQTAKQNFDSVLFSSGKSKFEMDNYGIYLQSIFRLSPLNIILGGRYDYNSCYGSSFVPRFGITKVWPGAHLKALYSRAFRAPSISNMDVSPGLSPEKTVVAEVEAGILLFAKTYLTANVYDITTSDPIVFYYDENENDKYMNESSTGTRGFEVEYKWKSNGWYLAANYSYYTTAGHNIISIYNAPGNENKLLAFPQNEINLNSNIQLNKKINLNPSINWFSGRYSYSESIDGDINSKYHNPVLTANFSLNFEDILCDGLLVQASCFNITNERSLFIQPYNGNHAPIQGQGRQLQLKIKYTILFKRK